MKKALFLFFILLSGVLVSNSQTPETLQAGKEQLEAERVWEQIIKVRGGREKLHSVSNLVLTKGDSPSKNQIEVYVYPDRYWEWSKGKIVYDYQVVTLTNLLTGIHQLATEKGITSSKNLIIGDPRASYRESWLMEASMFLLETRWLKPTPIRVTRQKIGKEQFDVIETRFPNLSVLKDWGLLYYVDPESLEVRRVAGCGDDGKPYSYYYFDGQTTVDGIVVPKSFVSFLASSRVENPNKKSFVPLTFQFNVDYDEKLFERPPSVGDGPDAWKRKKN